MGFGIGTKYIDFCLMGVGTNLLGYSYKKINNYVIKKTLKDSNVTTLNSTNDLVLAEKLLDIHRWGRKARFAKTGGANSIAVRIARSFTNTEKIALADIMDGMIGIYHQICKIEKFEQPSFKNLNPQGVPSSLKNTSFSI